MFTSSARSDAKRGSGRPVTVPLSLSGASGFGGSGGGGAGVATTGGGGGGAGLAAAAFGAGFGGGFCACVTPCGFTTGGGLLVAGCTGSRGAACGGVGCAGSPDFCFDGTCNVPVVCVASGDASSRLSTNAVGRTRMVHGCQAAASRVKLPDERPERAVANW